jgi:N-methylhydantoinase B
LERDPRRVLRDVVREYISPDVAREDYGVVLVDNGANLEVDIKATEEMRHALQQRSR